MPDPIRPLNPANALADQRNVAAGSLRAWVLAVRPMSLLVAVGPVLVGASFGYLRTGALDGRIAAWALVAAVLMQLITNLQNDVGYTERGAEFLGQRTGLPRATALGLLGVRQVNRVIAGLAVMAAAMGFALVAYRGWPVLAVGAASLLAAWAYMGGPRPIAYTPWGEATAFLFFGPVAVLGTSWLLTGDPAQAVAFGADTLSVLASLCTGSMTAAALAVNNHRDRAHDHLVGRHTFAVLWGEGASTRLYQALLLLPFGVALALAVLRSPWLMLTGLLLPIAWRLVRDFKRCAPGVVYNAILMRTFRLSLGFAVLLSLGAVLSRCVT